MFLRRNFCISCYELTYLEYDTLDPLSFPSTISTALTNLRYLTLSDLFFNDFLCLFSILQHVITIKIVGLYCNNTDVEQLSEKLPECTNLYIYMGASDDGATFKHMATNINSIAEFELDVHFAPYINFFTQQMSNVEHQFKTLFWMERQTKLKTEANGEGFNLNVKF
ncbi:unnamed protein product [Didymodactylos carnosus]|uniref:Uncharacterized protein n=1 Tax=Didymodactylos carnosus TaxID=1234261 RepID=A0A815C2G8_9BILA|nr:unnamed protein product [Didymodactylos carnosus]CAF1306124.1 unnamed protein product [Didymodactylos carnosus]CAF4071506.1 unnamed protein product [Didymodactylos carnosus]CAF4113374.1 unnamed protein product [Didymodactylos carnosus]